MKRAIGVFCVLATVCLQSCPTPTPNPVGSDTYATWSTNFANLTDPSGAGIGTWIGGTQVSIETTNVNSGGKSIKDSGPVDDSHILQTYFMIHGLTGRDSVDLSDKTLSIEIYVPSGPPLGSLSIDLMSGSDSLMVRANIYAENLRGRWYTYTADTRMAVALGSWQYYDWMHTPAVASQADAVTLLQHIQTIRINAGNWGDLHEAGDAYFLVDKLGWAPSGAVPAYDPSADSLRKYAPANLLIGNFVESARSGDPQWLRFTLQECSCLEENQESTRWPATEPAGDDFTATTAAPADTFFDSVSDKLGSPMVRYLVFDSIPDWLTTKSYADTQTILENFVRAKVGHYKGKTKIWFMFNEMLRYDVGWVPDNGLDLKDRNQQPQTWGNEYSPFSSSPSDVTMIEDAFRVARGADPDALLFILDGANEEVGHPLPDAFYNLVAKLVSDGAPIDGVGMQAHLKIGADGNVHNIAGGPDYTLAFDAVDGLTGVSQNVDRFQALGLKVVFAEVDVPIYTADIDSSAAGQALLAQRRQTQADVYKSLLHITLTHANMPAFIMFASADLYSWYFDSPSASLHDYTDPGILDADFKPKPAYAALLDELKAH